MEYRDQIASLVGRGILDRRIFYKDQKICQAHTPADNIWVITKGEAVLDGGNLGEAKYTKDAGSLYGDVEAILGLDYQGDLTAKTPNGVEAIRIPATKLLDALAEAPPMIQALVKIKSCRSITAAEMMKVKELELDVSVALLEAYNNRNSDKGTSDV